MSIVRLESAEPVSPEARPLSDEASPSHSVHDGSCDAPHVTRARWIFTGFGFLLCFGVGACFARYAASLDADEFELRVDSLYETSEDLVVRLRLETTRRQFYVFWSPGIAHEWNALPLPTRSTWYADDEQQGELYLFCSTVFAAKEQRLKTILGDHRDHRTVPGVQDYSRLSVTIPSGRYPLNTPLLVGRLDGRDVYLAVGEVDTIQELRSRMPRRESTSDAIRPGTGSRSRFTPLTPASAALRLIPSAELDHRRVTPGRPRAEIAVPVTPGLHEGPKETPRAPVSPSHSPTLWPWSGCQRRPSVGLSKWDTCKRLSADPDMASG
jgi:hypothetical protein